MYKTRRFGIVSESAGCLQFEDAKCQGKWERPTVTAAKRTSPSLPATVRQPGHRQKPLRYPCNILTAPYGFFKISVLLKSVGANGTRGITQGIII